MKSVKAALLGEDNSLFVYYLLTFRITWGVWIPMALWKVEHPLFASGVLPILPMDTGGNARPMWLALGVRCLFTVAIVLSIIGFLSLGLYRHVKVIRVGERVSSLANIRSFIPAIALVCLFLIPSLLLILLRTFANRACMLGDLGVVASYRQGFEVLGANLGPSFILFLLQIAISVGVGLALFIPGALILLCCFLWPLLLLIQGTFAAFFSTLWTLAWNQWTG